MNRRSSLELKLVAELLKNSHRSDRELAKALKVSQPTITRNRARLEKERYVKEYTVVPDFHKLGFELASFNLVSMKKRFSTDESKKTREIQLKTMVEETAEEIVLFARGLGENYDAVVVAFHRSFSDYHNFVRKIEAAPFVNTSATLGFVINLADETQPRHLTFSTLGEYMLTMLK